MALDLNRFYLDLKLNSSIVYYELKVGSLLLSCLRFLEEWGKDDSDVYSVTPQVKVRI